MKIVRDNYLLITPETSFEFEEISKVIVDNCIHANPKYDPNPKRRTIGFQKKEPKTIQTYSKFQSKFEPYETFKIYKGNIAVYREVMNLGLPLNKFVDNRNSGKQINIQLSSGPRDKVQARALKEIKTAFNDFGYCCLSAVPAAGKTYCAVNLMAEYKVKTLILVDMTLLIDQFIESITKFSSIKEEEIGIIRSEDLKTNQIDDKKIYIATVQTLVKRPDIIERLQSEVGFLVIDEVHVASTETFQNVIPKFKTMYQIGLSGSHERDDEMEFLTHESVGPIVSFISIQDMLKEGSVVLPNLRPIFIEDNNKKTTYSDKNNADYRKDLVEAYYKDDTIINRISNLVMKHIGLNDSQLLICKETDVVERYQECLYRKIFTEDEYNLAVTSIQQYIESCNKAIRKIERAPNEEFTSDTVKKKLAKETITKKEYREKADKEREVQINKQLSLIKKKEKEKWFDQECLDESKRLSLRIMHGNLSKDERNKVIEDANAGVTKIILATTVLDKAISISRLNVLYLLFSTRERANTIQRVG